MSPTLAGFIAWIANVVAIALMALYAADAPWWALTFGPAIALYALLRLLCPDP